MCMVINLLRITFSNILWPLVIMLGSYALTFFPVSAAPFAYVTNEGSNTVTVIDTTTNKIVDSPIPVEFGPRKVAITPDGKQVYVVNASSNNVSVIDTTTNKVVGSAIQVGFTPEGVAITPDGKRVYVANVNSNTVSVIDTTTNKVVGSAIPVGSGPFALAITPDGKRVYVVNRFSSTVSVIDTTTNRVAGPPIPAGFLPFAVAITPLPKPSITLIDCLFNWAEIYYSNLFAPSGSPTQVWTNFTYRYYLATNAYLGVSSIDNHIYYLVDGNFNDEGPLSYWLPLAGCQ